MRVQKFIHICAYSICDAFSEGRYTTLLYSDLYMTLDWLSPTKAEDDDRVTVYFYSRRYIYTIVYSTIEY